MLAYEAEEKDYDAPEQPGRRQVSSALAGEAEKEEAGGCFCFVSGVRIHSFCNYLQHGNYYSNMTDMDILVANVELAS